MAMATSFSSSSCSSSNLPPRPRSLPISPPPRPPSRPTLFPLTSQQLGRLLPWTGSGDLISQEFGDPMAWAVRLSVSLASSVSVFRYSTLAAAVASLFWIWSPMWTAAIRSTLLRLGFPYAGVWRARVLVAQPVVQPPPPPTETPLQEIFQAFSESPSFLRLVIGDDSPALLEMEVPMSNKEMMVKVGEQAEVLVLSDRVDFSRFKAVRDVYFPRLGIWMAENPSVEKTTFETLSLALSDRSAYEDSRRTKDYLWDSGGSSLEENVRKDKRPLLRAVNLQDLWLASKEPRVWEISDDLDWESPQLVEKAQQQNDSDYT